MSPGMKDTKSWLKPQQECYVTVTVTQFKNFLPLSGSVVIDICLTAHLLANVPVTPPHTTPAQFSLL